MLKLHMQHTSQLVEKIKLEDKHYQKASKTSLEINAALHKCQISRDTLNGAHTAADDDDLVQLVMVTVLCYDMYTNIVYEGSAITATGKSNAHPRAPCLGSPTQYGRLRSKWCSVTFYQKEGCWLPMQLVSLSRKMASKGMSSLTKNTLVALALVFVPILSSPSSREHEMPCRWSWKSYCNLTFGMDCCNKSKTAWST